MLVSNIYLSNSCLSSSAPSSLPLPPLFLPLPLSYICMCVILVISHMHLINTLNYTSYFLVLFYILSHQNIVFSSSFTFLLSHSFSTPHSLCRSFFFTTTLFSLYRINSFPSLSSRQNRFCDTLITRFPKGRKRVALSFISYMCKDLGPARLIEMTLNI